jgi:uncharacterized alkaline shock family protein YloU
MQNVDAKRNAMRKDERRGAIQPTGLDMSMGNVTVSPDVVRELARITTLATPGVLGLAEKTTARGQTHGELAGVNVVTQNEQGASRIKIHLCVIAATDQPLHKLGEQIQANVVGAVAEVAGIEVASVDVTFEDVRNKA